MQAEEILSRVDHTLLKQTATWADIQKICEEAVQYHTATVMIPSCFIPKIRENYGGKLKIATVVGFPNGNCNTAAKVAETAQALADGAEEIDMVINVGMLKAGETEYVTEEIRALKRLCGDRVLKVIVETCFLTEEEKIAACKASVQAGAAFVKTSTGFSTGGATVHDVALMKQAVDGKAKIKASGGIRTPEFTAELVEAGADRIGAGDGMKLL